MGSEYGSNRVQFYHLTVSTLNNSTYEYPVTPYVNTNNPYGGPTQGIPMGWYPPELTPDDKIEKAKEVKVQQVKDVKRHVLGPKRSRWG